MRLIGMMDSPYVRRVAISMHLMGLPFEHEPLSVFRQYDDFAAINPVVKAPTLVTDDGIVLMESSLILQYLDTLVASGRRLIPADPLHAALAFRIIGLALAACEKTVQIVYEQNLRPEAKWHQPWLDRVTKQLSEAYRSLEGEIADMVAWPVEGEPTQADVTAAVAWCFTQSVLPDGVSAETCPALERLSVRAEALPAFLACPFV